MTFYALLAVALAAAVIGWYRGAVAVTERGMYGLPNAAANVIGGVIVALVLVIAAFVVS